MVGRLSFEYMVVRWITIAAVCVYFNITIRTHWTRMNRG